MSKGRKWIFRCAALAVIIAVAVWMFIIGRGHTLYFDNKPLEKDGQSFDAIYQIEVLVDGNPVGKLKEGERGMTTIMGQSYDLEVYVTMKKDGKRSKGGVTMKVPYNMDGIIVNLPALLNGAAEDVYMEEFIPAAVEEESDADVVVTDEFAMPTDE